MFCREPDTRKVCLSSPTVKLPPCLTITNDIFTSQVCHSSLPVRLSLILVWPSMFRHELLAVHARRTTEQTRALPTNKSTDVQFMRNRSNTPIKDKGKTCLSRCSGGNVYYACDVRSSRVHMRSDHCRSERVGGEEMWQIILVKTSLTRDKKESRLWTWRERQILFFF